MQVIYSKLQEKNISILIVVFAFWEPSDENQDQ